MKRQTYEDLRPRDAGSANTLANLFLVSVSPGTVDVPVAMFQSMFDGVDDFLGLGLPCTYVQRVKTNQ